MKRIFFLILAFYVSNFASGQTQTKDDSIKAYYQNEIIISATKSETELLKLPLSVFSYNQEKINTQILNNPNIGELVRNLPGVSVGHGNRNTPPWIHLRGTGYFIGRTLYMVDEIPLIEPRLCIAVNPDNLQSTEVLLGPSSSLYGPNASGGAIDAISRNGASINGIIPSISYGTFNSIRPSILIGEKIDNWDFAGSYMADKSDGYKNMDMNAGIYLYKNNYPSYLNSVNIEDQNFTNQFAYGRIGYKNDLNTLGFNINFHYFNEKIYGGRQNSNTNGYRIIGTGSVYYTIPEFAKFILRYGFQELYGSSNGTKGLLKVNKNQINGRFVYLDIDSTNSYVYDPTISQVSESDNKSLPFDFQSDWYFLKNHLITIGASYTKEIWESKTWNPDKSKILSGTDYDIYRKAIYAQSLSDFIDKKLNVLLGLRYDHWKYSDIADSGSTIKNPSDVTKDAVTYRAGIKYNLNNQISLRASYGTAFWPGSATWFFQNISTGNTWREANPDLKPEKTNMVDLGADLNFAHNSIQSSITFYYGKIIDAISYRYDQHPTSPGVQIIRTQNSDEVDIKGIELSFKYNPVAQIELFANNTFNKSEITKSPTNRGNRLRNCPDYFGNLGIIWNNNEIINIRLSGRYSGDRYYNDENTKLDYFHMSEYFVVDAKIWKPIEIFGNNFTCSIGIDNIFDKKYDAEFINCAPGRYIEAGIKYCFGL